MMLRTLIALLLLVCLFSSVAPKQKSSALAPRSSSPAINEEEAEVLLTFYDSLPAQLTPRQQELVESYRALKEYLAAERPGVRFCVELLEPGSRLSPTGKSYDTFHILWDDAGKGKYAVSKQEDGTLAVRNLASIGD